MTRALFWRCWRHGSNTCGVCAIDEVDLMTNIVQHVQWWRQGQPVMRELDGLLAGWADRKAHAAPPLPETHLQGEGSE